MVRGGDEPRAVGRSAFVTEEKGSMRTSSKWGAWLLTALAGLAPGAASGQEYAPPDFQLPIPIYHTHPEVGGLYTYYSFAMYRQNNPIKSQTVAVIGFVDVDGSITGTPQ